MNWKRRIAKEWLILLGVAVFSILLAMIPQVLLRLDPIAMPAPSPPNEQEVQSWSIEYLSPELLREMVDTLQNTFVARKSSNSKYNYDSLLIDRLSTARAAIISGDYGEDLRSLLNLQYFPLALRFKIPGSTARDELQRLRALETYDSTFKAVLWPYYVRAMIAYRESQDSYREHRRQVGVLDAWSWWLLILPYPIVLFSRSVAWSIRQVRSKPTSNTSIT